MIEYITICTVALLASGLTLFSGFGLGTILMPVFALFFPLPLAIASTAVVHLSNNLFKLLLLGRHADRGVVIRFGIPALVFAAVLAAFLGAFLGNRLLRKVTIRFVHRLVEAMLFLVAGGLASRLI
jgi:hypothetical protein